MGESQIRRANKVTNWFAGYPVTNLRDTNGASTVAQFVCGFKIECDEVHRGKPYTFELSRRANGFGSSASVFAVGSSDLFVGPFV